MVEVAAKERLWAHSPQWNACGGGGGVVADKDTVGSCYQRGVEAKGPAKFMLR